MLSILEIHNRKGALILRAVGATGIIAAVTVHVIRWAAIVLLTQSSGPWLP